MQGNQFEYPWGVDWHGLGSSRHVRPRTPAPFKKRRLSKFDRKMLDRITSKRTPKPDELGIHPDQMELSL